MFKYINHNIIHEDLSEWNSNGHLILSTIKSPHRTHSSDNKLENSFCVNNNYS